MKHLSKLVFAFATLVPAVAFAGAGGISANATVNVIPVGNIAFEGGGLEFDESLAIAYGFGAQVDYWVTEQISIGFAPRYTLGLKPDEDDSDETASQLDLMLRAQYNHTLNPQMQVFGFVAPGYSIIMPPDSGDDDLEDPKGLAIGFGAGGRYGINEKLFAQAEIGYQIGMQGGEQSGVEYDFKTSFLHIGVGIGSHF